LEILNPVDLPHWDDLLISAKNCTFFHSSAWARVLSESYGYRPLYFSRLNQDRLSALIPVMEVKSFLTGRRGVSLPFTDYCEPILAESLRGQDLFREMVEYGKKKEWKFIELRGGKVAEEGAIPSLSYFSHILDLKGEEKRIFSGFRRGTKSSVKKALSSGVKAEISCSLGAVQEFFRLNGMTRRRHGLPPQPFHFFEKMWDHILSKGLGFVTLASYQGRAIAGALFFHFGKAGLYKYAASDIDYQSVRPSNLVIWEAIRWFRRNGFEHLCFGKTEPENYGLRQFKQGWGTKEKVIHYYKYDLIKDAFVRDRPRERGFHNKIFRRMPAPLLRMTGSVLYKHMG